MSETLTAIAGVLTAEKAPGAVLNYTLDYVPDMGEGETIVSSVWTAPAGLTLSQSSFDGTRATIVIAGGTAGNWYVIENLATSSAGLVHEGSIQLYIKDPAALGDGLNLPFPSVLSALASLRRDRLVLLTQNFLPGTILEQSYLLEKLVAATALIQRRLRVCLVPTEILPNTASQAEIDALTLAGNVVQLEPAYDYDPFLFQGDQWGFMPLRQRPIIAVHSMKFTYPTPNNTIFQIPNDWIRVDRKAATINLLPTQNAVMLPLNAFIMSAIGGGSRVPSFVEIRYRAGLENIARDWPDILDVILKSTVLGVVEDMFIPSSTSGSVSADGLSQSDSVSLKMSDYQDIIDAKLGQLQSALFGIRLAVL